MSLSGQVTLVAGAARGIGRAIAETLAANGAEVVVADINSDEAESTATAITAAGGRAFAAAHDVRSEQSSADVVAGILDRRGRHGILVNNAGVGPACGRARADR